MTRIIQRHSIAKLFFIAIAFNAGTVHANSQPATHIENLKIATRKDDKVISLRWNEGHNRYSETLPLPNA